MSEEGPFVLLLHDTLICRPKRYHIQRLVISNCNNVSSGDIDLLESCAKVVEWSGPSSTFNSLPLDFTFLDQYSEESDYVDEDEDEEDEEDWEEDGEEEQEEQEEEW